VVVTRGDVDLSPVVSTLLHFDEVIVWDNSKRRDVSVYGRFLGAAEARNEVVYVQDDDCLVDSAAVVAEYRPGVVSSNVPMARRAFYSDGVTLIGWGAIFDRAIAWDAFGRYWERFAADGFFQRECDRIFTGLSKCRNFEAGLEHLEYASGSDRMGAEKRHLSDLAEVRGRLRAIR